ncbi:MAG: carbamoyl-phosphate synthase subunit [Nocardioidaceae bacterium]|nr:carbamoyl-phosphate synthase subunit [Nocardioidaceae bacterium]
MFTSVLIANRGEIALRIIRAAKSAGIRSIAVYSDADKGAPYVRAADEAVHIGPTLASESYLNIDKILAAAKATGAEAIHPGYGFLSERAPFVRAVKEAGLIFIGPTADVMDAMGRKDHARTIAERANVPVTPRFDEDGVTEADYPVLVKAAAGGGGKGMRVVREASQLGPSIDSARREAANSFGDDTLLIEKYVEGGRHIEVQVIADEHGNVVHLFERDCSAQRRHQKVVEEAPAARLSDAVRKTLLDSSVALCREVGYTNAGTVEFLVHGDNAYFLEMNTRLQVEHPVTEDITGIDLVQWQFAVAAGQPLPLSQDEITQSGHAIEVRVYAEDPYSGFLPQAGKALDVVWPADARIEASFERGQAVSTSYDPMLAKIITHGVDRDAARKAMIKALDETAVFGITTNIGFLRALVASEAFAHGDVHTGWLDSDASKALTTKPELPAEAVEAAAKLWAHTTVLPSGDPFGAADSWRSAGDPAPIQIHLIDELGQEYAFDFATEDFAHVGALAMVDSSGVSIAWHGQPWRLNVPDPMRAAHAVAGEADVVSPMPGTVISVTAVEGVTVEAGTVLGVVEAMKMELALKAPYDGVVTVVRAAVGERVGLGDLLFTVEPMEGA